MLGIYQSRKKYFGKLKEQIEEMPFIYRDIDSSILTDFVDIEAKAMDIYTLQSKISKNPLVKKEKSLDMLKDRKRVILFGNAGVGKTTFFRH